MSVEVAVAEHKFVAGSGVQLELSEYTENGRVFRNWKFQRIKGKAVEEVKKEVKKKEVKKPKEDPKKNKQRASRKEVSERRQKEKKEAEMRREAEAERRERSRSRRRRSPLARRNKQARVEEEERREMARLASREAIESEAQAYKDRRRTLPSSEVDLDKEMTMEELLKKYREMAIKVEALEKAQAQPSVLQDSHNPEASHVVSKVSHTLNRLTYNCQRIHNVIGYEPSERKKAQRLEELNEAFSQMRG